MNRPSNRAWRVAASKALSRAIDLSPLLVAAVGLYIAVAYRDVGASVAELGHAALTLLHQGFIGNPFNDPTGPTAHVSPIPTGLLAAVYGAAGGNSSFSRSVLSILCLASYVLCCAVAIGIGKTLCLRPSSMLAIVVPTTLVPFELYNSLVPLRQWDQPYAAVLLMLALLIAIREVTAPAASMRPASGQAPAVAGLGLLTGISALCSPMAMPACAVAAAVLVWRTSGVLRRLRLVGLYAIIVVGLMLPWAVRNERVLGGVVMTRANFPMEFLLGNLGSPRSNDITPASRAFHPNQSPDAVRRINQIGELGYMAELRKLAGEWLWAHKLTFLGLSVERVWLSFFPARDTVEWRPVFGAAGTFWAFTVFGACKLVALVAGAVLLRHRLVWLAFSVLPLAPYFITHIETRYTFPVFFPSACLMAAVLDRIQTIFRARTAPSARR